MAQVTVRKVVEGINNLVVHAYFESDGVSGELSNTVLLAPADLIPALLPNPTFRIMRIWHSLMFNLTLKYNSLTPTPVWVIPAGRTFYQDFREMGGLSDYVGPPDSDGKLVMSSSGFTVAGTNGSLVMELRKP